jgi:hypothetical protein
LETLLGLVLLAVYVVGMIALAAVVTYAAIKIFPTKDRPSKKDSSPPPSDDGAGGGRLFRKAKRGEA